MNKVGSVEAVIIAGLVTIGHCCPLFCTVFILFELLSLISATLVTNLFVINKGSEFVAAVRLLVCQVLEDRLCPIGGHSVETRIRSLSFIS